jgi:protein-tyrosine phosphatase
LSEGPPPGTYWVLPRRLLAGAYPAGLDRLREAGVTLLVDLTEESEYGLASYAAQLEAGMRTIRMPIADFSCPAPEQMTEILDLIDAELAAGSVVYVHCYGGVGRTGTVVGCWLVRHGATAKEAVEQLRRPPETPEQRQFIESWSKSLDRGMRHPDHPS